MTLQLRIKNNDIISEMKEIGVASYNDNIFYVISNKLFTDLKYYFQQNYMSSIYLTDSYQFIIIGQLTIQFSKIPTLIYNNLILQRVRDGWIIKLNDSTYKNIPLEKVVESSEYGTTASKPRPILVNTFIYFTQNLNKFLSSYLIDLKNTSLIKMEGGII